MLNFIVTKKGFEYFDIHNQVIYVYVSSVIL